MRLTTFVVHPSLIHSTAGKLAVLKDDEVDRLERAAAAASGPGRQVGSACVGLGLAHQDSKQAMPGSRLRVAATA